MAGEVRLRAVQDSDLPVFFTQQLDPEANAMAAFAARDPADRDAFMAHWANVRGDPANRAQTIEWDGQVAGYIGSWQHEGHREVGYCIGRAHWGQGIATRALAAFVASETARPLYAYVAKDNLASLRVLDKCGFARYGENKEFANARGTDVEQFIMVLEANAGTP
ncbi:MAG TPA: GNAT family N-acetyltransferase [Ktedonobacterales bacterium]|jgi:RimJ/RimL family protein N-acetyltransferase